ncbi:NADH dehydrogenase alpha subcomplex subunit 8, partial [Neoconidiobolus thromboides FSU 785]
MSAGNHPQGASAYDFRIEGKHIETSEMPSNIPKVTEVGASSAPLTSASYFLHAHCKNYYDDFMLCKNENNDPAHCLKEGRKVTRCSVDLLEKLQKNCESEFSDHWKCLDNNNFEYRFCRQPEQKFNACVFKKLGYEKIIPGAPKDEVPIHLRKNTLL